MLTGFYWIDIGIALMLAGLWGGAALLTAAWPQRARGAGFASVPE